MTKYQEYFKKMLSEHEDLFKDFREIHDAYSEDPSLQVKYNETGKPIIELIREYEDRLCHQSEGGGYAKFSGNLAEKFWDQVRTEFPLIDRVGVIIKKADNDMELKRIEMFELKRIKLV
jgi:hypothetical protein